METLGKMEYRALQQLQAYMAAEERRVLRLKAAHDRFIAKHQEAGDWVAKKVEYNRKYYQAKIAKRKAELEDATKKYTR